MASFVKGKTVTLLSKFSMALRTVGLYPATGFVVSLDELRAIRDKVDGGTEEG